MSFFSSMARSRLIFWNGSLFPELIIIVRRIKTNVAQRCIHVASIRIPFSRKIQTRYQLTGTWTTQIRYSALGSLHPIPVTQYIYKERRAQYTYSNIYYSTILPQADVDKNEHGKES